MTTQYYWYNHIEFGDTVISTEDGGLTTECFSPEGTDEDEGWLEGPEIEHLYEVLEDNGLDAPAGPFQP